MLNFNVVMVLRKITLFLGLLACFLVACRDEAYTPKPRGYFRLSVQDTTYQPLRGSYPFFFEYSDWSFIDSLANEEKNWINVIYPDLEAVLYITYRDMDKAQLEDLINDSRMFAFKQIVKADDIIESRILDSTNHLYGRIYEATGNDAACTFQFWITDREEHFFRASLYLNTVPQNDSLSPVITYLKKDMMHLIETFKWN
jgi:gliding motility-associated lipoprotein GldD